MHAKKKINSENYHEYSKAYESLKLKKAELLHKLKTQRLKEQLGQLDSIELKHNNAQINISNAVQVIEEMCKNVPEFQKLLNRNEPFINIPHGNHDAFQKVFAMSIRFMEEIKSEKNIDLNENLTPALDNLKTIAKHYNILEETDKNGRLIIKHISTDTGESSNEKVSPEIITDVARSRTRRSDLSDSTFCTSFQMGNPSTSSPKKD